MLAQPVIPSLSAEPDSAWFFNKIKDLILLTQTASEEATTLKALTTSTLTPFPQTALVKAAKLIHAFPVTARQLTGNYIAGFLLTLHPALKYNTLENWTSLSEQCDTLGLNTLGSRDTILTDGTGFFGYKIIAIERVNKQSAKVVFISKENRSIELRVAAGPKTFLSWPLKPSADRLIIPRFLSMLTMLFQIHAIGYDVLFVPPNNRATASASSSLLILTFAELLGYSMENIHLYKELGGRELLQRRHLGVGGATYWMPSPLIRGNFVIILLVNIQTLTKCRGMVG